jgi:hypothetical protein
VLKLPPLAAGTSAAGFAAGCTAVFVGTAAEDAEGAGADDATLFSETLLDVDDWRAYHVPPAAKIRNPAAAAAIKIILLLPFAECRSRIAASLLEGTSSVCSGAATTALSCVVAGRDTSCTSNSSTCSASSRAANSFCAGVAALRASGSSQDGIFTSSESRPALEELPPAVGTTLAGD